MCIYIFTNLAPRRGEGGRLRQQCTSRVRATRPVRFENTPRVHNELRVEKCETRDNDFPVALLILTRVGKFFFFLSYCLFFFLYSRDDSHVITVFSALPNPFFFSHCFTLARVIGSRETTSLLTTRDSREFSRVFRDDPIFSVFRVSSEE